MTPSNKKNGEDKEIVPYRDICAACIGKDESRRREAMKLIVRSARKKMQNIQLFAFINEGVRLNVLLGQTENLLNLMRIVKTLVEAKVIPPDHQLYDILQSCLTCCICEYDPKELDDNLHWQVREYSAMRIVSISESYESECNYLMDFILDDIFQSLKPLLDDSQENPQTLAASRLAGLYGILCCFNLFGYDILAQFVLPNMSALCKHLNQMMKREQTLKLSFGCNAPANNFRMQFRAERIAFGRVQHYLIRELAVPLQKWRHMTGRSVTEDAYKKDYGEMGTFLYMSKACFKKKNYMSSVVGEALRDIPLQKLY